MTGAVLALWSVAMAAGPEPTGAPEAVSAAEPVAAGAQLVVETAPETAPVALGLDPATIVGTPEGAPLAGEALAEATRATGLKLRCPTCQGMSVAESPAEGARAMKVEVEKMRAAGFSEQQVLDFFEASYGPFILLAPRREGANLALWIAPPALLLLGGLLAMGQLRRGRKALPPPPPSAGKSDPWRERVRREIEE